jgi:asparagine synthase (glutamine-hydrolysing)
VSSSLVELLGAGVPRDLDWEALSVFFRWGGLIGEDTPFASIRMLPPGGVLEWEAGHLTITAPDIRVKPLQMTRDAAIDGFIDHVAAAVATRAVASATTGATLLPLSGGRDSRHLLLRLLQSGQRPALCVTARYGRSDPLDECTIARQLATRVEVAHRIVEAPVSFVGAEAEKNLAIGFTSLMHAWYLPIVATGLEAGATSVYDGLQLLPFAHEGWGEERRMALMESGQYELMANEWVRAAPLRYLLPSVRRRLGREAAVARLARELERYADWPNPLGAFLAMNRTRRAIGNALFGLWPSHVTVHCPFLDRQVFDHLLGLSPDVTMIGRNFHEDAISRAFPEYADIPYAGAVKPVQSVRKDFAVAREVLWFLADGGFGPLLDGGYIFPRALRAAVDPRYCRDARSLARVAVYARQLGFQWRPRTR